MKCQGPESEQSDGERSDDYRDTAPGIFVFLLGVVLGELSAGAVFLFWGAIKRLVAW